MTERGRGRERKRERDERERKTVDSKTIFRNVTKRKHFHSLLNDMLLSCLPQKPLEKEILDFQHEREANRQHRVYICSVVCDKYHGIKLSLQLLPRLCQGCIKCQYIRTI